MRASTLVLASAMFVGVRGAKYQLMSHGSGACDEDSKPVTSYEECRLAAKASGQSDTEPSLLGNVPNLPFGCFFKPKTKMLFFNPKGVKSGGDYPLPHFALCKVAASCAMDVALPKNAGWGSCKKGAKMVHGETCKFTCPTGFIPIGAQPQCKLGEDWAGDNLDGNVVSSFECAYIGTCASILTKDSNAKSGMYAIDSDGKGPMPGYKAFCDMESAKGGFQLVMRRVNGHKATGPSATPTHMGGSAYISDEAWGKLKPKTGSLLVKFYGKRVYGTQKERMVIADIKDVAKPNCANWGNLDSLSKAPLFHQGDCNCKNPREQCGLTQSFMFGPTPRTYFSGLAKNFPLYTDLNGDQVDKNPRAWDTAELWVRSTSPSPPLPKKSVCIDLDGDGSTGPADLMAMLGAYGMNDCELRDYDLNGDCIVGAADLLILLQGFNCQHKDCAGVTGGKAKKDGCGKCGGDGSSCADCHGTANGNAKKDCAGTCGGKAQKDQCGKCDIYPENNCIQDCAGAWGGTAKKDCAGKCRGDAVKDNCGTCDSNKANDCEQDCAGEWGGKLVKDCKGKCGGKASVDKCGTCDEDPNNNCNEDHYVVPVVTQTSSTVDWTYNTYRLHVKLVNNAKDVYTIRGSSKGPLVLPPAWQVSKQGANIGGVNPDVIRRDKTAAFDSWLTVGITGGDTKSELSSAALADAFSKWDEKQGIKSSDCSVFWKDPKKTLATKANGNVVVAQLTLKTKVKFTVEMGMAGKQASGKTWSVDSVKFHIGGGNQPPPAPPPTQNTGGKYCDPVIIQQSTSVDKDHTTLRLGVKLKGQASSVHSIVGSSKGAMVLPPAYQVATYGKNFGGIDPDIVKIVSVAGFDSWLTVGLTNGDKKNELGSAGMKLSFEGWNVRNGIKNTDCSIFWMDKKNSRATADSGTIVLAQLTVSSSYKGSAYMGILGGVKDGKAHWRDDHIAWMISPSSSPPPPPPSNKDCAGVANGNAQKDNCGKCDKDTRNDCVKDCKHKWGGTTKVDRCGVCGGDGKSCPTQKGGKFSDPEVHTMSASVDENWVTYRLAVKLKNNAKSMYTIVGAKGAEMVIPPAYQVKTFGKNFGGVDLKVIQLVKQAAFDSWLTVGITNGDTDNELGSAGLKDQFSAWSDKRGIKSSDCALFWMDPKSTRATSSAAIVVAQLTVKKDYSGVAKMGIAGKLSDGKAWRDDKLEFKIGK